MAKSYHVLTALGVLIFGAWAAHFAIFSGEQDGRLECLGARVSTYGWSHRDRPLAEMAAILRWKEIAKEQAPGYAAWHNAQRRYLSCRTIGSHFQCRISATPCRRAGAKGA